MKSQSLRFSGRRFVWLQSPPWHGLWTRQNHFSRRLAAEGAEVLYVESPISASRRLRTKPDRTLLTGRVLRDVEPRLHVMQLPLQIPGSGHSEILGRLNGRAVARSVARWIAQEEWTNPIAWCRLPLATETLRHVDPAHVVYDVVDDYAYYATSERARRITIARETTLASSASQIFTTTQALADRLEPLNPNIRVVPNGVDPIFFAKAAGLADPMPDVPHPRIGYIGVVASWMDFDLLRRMCARWPGHVVVVGPVMPEVRDVYESIPGLVRVPAIHNLDLPKYLRSFDVCIMPHKMIELRHRADPLKVIEYLSSGRPIVSTALRGVLPMRGLVDIAHEPAGFLAAVNARLSEAADSAAAEARIAFAKSRTWDKLYDRVVESLLERGIL